MPSGRRDRRYAGGELRRDAIVAFVERFTAEHRYSPTLREIAAGVGLRSPSSAVYQVEQLIDAGVLEHTPGHARSVRLSPVES